jgi:hypothetical protein
VKGTTCHLWVITAPLILQQRAHIKRTCQTRAKHETRAHQTDVPTRAHQTDLPNTCTCVMYQATHAISSAATIHTRNTTSIQMARDPTSTYFDQLALCTCLSFPAIRICLRSFLPSAVSSIGLANHTTNEPSIDRSMRKVSEWHTCEHECTTNRELATLRTINLTNHLNRNMAERTICRSVKHHQISISHFDGP